ncbi:MAG TPA: sialidase family protein [Nevskiaceae bacterium]|nr:sialidase family protein [Nevskiaceae bacterium]
MITRLDMRVVRAACAIALLFAGMAPARAATPANGTISPGSTQLSFTGGPFYVPNQTDAGYIQAGVPDPICASPGTDCDLIPLTADLPDDYATTHPNDVIAIKTSWTPVTGTGGATDACFATYLLDATGAVVNAAYTCANPEVMIQPAGEKQTQYTIEIIPELPLGQSYTTTVELTTAGASSGAALPPNGVPPLPVAFSQTISPEGMGDNAGEPSIGVDWNPNNAALKHDLVNTGGVVFFQSGPNTLRVSFDDATVPATALWEDVSTPLVYQFVLSDPIGFVDHMTGRVFALDLIGVEGQSFTAFSDDDGATWTPSEGGPPGGSPDHETLASGPYAGGGPLPGLGPLYPSAVYYCGQAIVNNFCARSDDGGLLFGPQIPTLLPTDCAPAGAQNGHVKVGPDGAVYLPQGKCPGLIGANVAGISVSQDNGLTWTYTAVPNSSSISLDPSVGIDGGNNAYLTWLDNAAQPHVAVSTDHGATWSNDTLIGAPFGIQSANLVIAAAGDAGRAAVGFIGTTTAGDPNGTNTFRGVWHLYIAMTYDAGKTWTTIDATPNDPVQVGSVCTSGTTCGADRNLLDFNDLQVDREGRVLAAYAKGCLAPDCVTATALSAKPPYDASRANKAVVVRQACGLSLFAAYDDKFKAQACPAVQGAQAAVTGATSSPGRFGGALPWALLLPLAGFAALRRRRMR